VATIQKIKNKKGISYRVLIRKAGYKTISKTFSSKGLASEYALKTDSLRSDRNPINISFRDVSKEYRINRYKSVELTPVPYESRIRYWDDLFRDREISKVSRLDISIGLDNLPKHLCKASKNKFRGAVSAVISYACKNYGLSINPVANIPPYKENNARTRYLSNEEKTSLLEACRHSHWNKLYLIVLLAITTGARKGELERLKWSDIDFDRGLAYVHQTKNGEPRVLPLTKQVLSEMYRVGRDAELIFNSSIKPNKPYEFRKEWIKALRRADIKDFRFHDLRHTCASYLAQNGASLLEIADVLGHKQIQMTKRYAHLCVSHKQKLIEKYFGEI